MTNHHTIHSADQRAMTPGYVLQTTLSPSVSAIVSDRFLWQQWGALWLTCACHIDPPTHLHSILSLSFYNLGSQFLPFISLLDGILPMDCQSNNEDKLAGTGPEDQILAQVGDCDFSWKGECFVKVSPHILIHNYAVSSEFLPFTGLKSARCLLEDF